MAQRLSEHFHSVGFSPHLFRPPVRFFECYPRPKLRDLENYTVDHLLYFIKCQRREYGYMDLISKSVDHGLEYRSPKIETLIQKMMTIWQKDTIMRDAALGLDANRSHQVRISIPGLTEPQSYYLVLNPAVFLCLADQFTYSMRNPEQVPCMDYFTIDEHKVYWVEAMEVVVNDHIRLCEDSKAMWNEAVEISLDIYRELARRQPPVTDCWDPEEFVDGVILQDSHGFQRFFFHPPNVASDLGTYKNYFHPILFEGHTNFKPKKTATKIRKKLNDQQLTLQKEWYLWGLPNFKVTHKRRQTIKMPEESIIQDLSQKKISSLSKNPKDYSHDMILRLSLDGGTPAVCRRFRISGIVKLDLLGSQLIPALLGWCASTDVNDPEKKEWESRRFHYHFIDDSDGAIFTSSRSEANKPGESKYFPLDTCGWRMIDDSGVHIGQVLRQIGDRILFCHGPWRYQISLQEVMDESKADSSIVVLDGSLAAPPFLSDELLPNAQLFDVPSISGNLCYQNLVLRHMVSGDVKDRNQLFRVLAPSERDFILQISKHLGRTFDPFCFNLKSALDAVTHALRLEHNINVCNICGSPRNLKNCEGCGVKKYCSKRCGKKDARFGHRHECKKIKQICMKETQNIESKFNHDENNNRSEGNGRSAEDGGVVLEHFELVQKNLENIPKNIFAAPGAGNLKVLNISKNVITHIPDCFGDSLPSLEHFDASFNKIQKPPPSMGNLLKLKYLDLNNNELLELPESMGRLPRLETLRLDSNYLTSLAPLKSIHSLTQLFVCSNDLQLLPSLPDSLKVLEASKNQLISANVGHLRRLESLKLNVNRIGGVVSDLAQLSKLSLVDLSQNNITGIWDPCASVKTLEKIYLHQNRISSLPSWISGFELTKLEKLTLGDNDLQGMPFNNDHFGVGQRKLAHLDLSGNKIQGLPTSLGFLTRVEFLDVGMSRDIERRRNPTRNFISVIPKSIVHMEKLQYLNLSGNSVRELPADFGSLVSLTQLDMVNNQLVSLPDSFVQLPRLKKLNLSYNKLELLPVDFHTLNSLLELDLRGNPLKVVPDMSHSLLVFELPSHTTKQKLYSPPSYSESFRKESPVQSLPTANLPRHPTGGSQVDLKQKLNSDGGTDRSFSDDDDALDENYLDYDDDDEATAEEQRKLFAFMQEKVRVGEYQVISHGGGDNAMRRERQEKNKAKLLMEENRKALEKKAGKPIEGIRALDTAQWSIDDAPGNDNSTVQKAPSAQSTKKKKKKKKNKKPKSMVSGEDPESPPRSSEGVEEKPEAELEEEEKSDSNKEANLEATRKEKCGPEAILEAQPEESHDAPDVNLIDFTDTRNDEIVDIESSEKKVPMVVATVLIDFVDSVTMGESEIQDDEHPTAEFVEGAVDAAVEEAVDGPEPDGLPDAESGVVDEATMSEASCDVETGKDEISNATNTFRSGKTSNDEKAKVEKLAVETSETMPWVAPQNVQTVPPAVELDADSCPERMEEEVDDDDDDDERMMQEDYLVEELSENENGTVGGGPDLIEELTRAIKQSRMTTMTVDDLETPNPPNVTEDCFLDVFVSAVDSKHANICWIQLSKYDEARKRLIKEMTKFYTGKSSLSDNSDLSTYQRLRVGSLIAVKPPLNRQWFRAQIRRIGFCSDGSGGRVLIAEVLYIDAGDVQRVPLEDVCRLDDRFRKTKPFAVECLLPDILPQFDASHGRRVWSPNSVTYFEGITLARQSLPIKMRVLGQGFEDFINNSSTVLEAEASKGVGVSEMVGEWGSGVEDVFRVYLFTTFGAQRRRLNDVSTMMWNAGFADYRNLPEQ